MKGDSTGIKASCGNEVKVGDEVDCYCRESDGFISAQVSGIVTDKNERGNYEVDGNDLALTCAPNVDLINVSKLIKR